MGLGYNPYRDPRNGQFTTAGGIGSALDKMFGIKDRGTTSINPKTEKPQKDYDFSERAQYVDEKLTKWRNANDGEGFDTRAIYREGAEGLNPYNNERAKQQEKLLNEIWKTKAEKVPNEGKAIMAGGLGGAGKGFTLEKKMKVDPDKYFTINPDDIKEAMAKNGMIPQVDKKMTLMELSPLAHEEASDMANMLAQKAYKERKNIIWDITMSSKKSVAEKRLKPMRAAGYDQIEAVFVDVTVDKSVAQATQRWENGLRENQELGGRFLPSSATAENMPKGNKFRSNNREVFEEVKDLFDGYTLWDNETEESGKKPIETSGTMKKDDK